MQIRLVLLAACMAGPATAAPAGKLPDLDLGLWRWTTTLTSGGPTIPPDALAKLDPANRQALEMKLQAAKGPHVYRSCLTEQKLREGFSLNSRAVNCTHEIIASNAHQFEQRSLCHTPRMGDLHVHVTMTVTDRDNVTGTVEGTHGDATTGSMATLAGTRVAADCGQVK